MKKYQSRLVFGTLLVLLSPMLLQAAPTTFTVTKTADTNDGTCNTDCSLREAIAAANGNGNATETDVIVFQALTNNDTYELNLAGSGEDSNATGDLDITQNVTMTGNGAGKTLIDGKGIDRVLQIFTGITVMLQEATIQGGDATTDPGFTYGGGIFNLGDLTLSNVRITNNKATVGGGIVNADGTLKISRSTIDNNQVVKAGDGSEGEGGGISVFSGSATLTNSTISGNTAANTGGGIRYESVTINLHNVTIFGNTAAQGGGIIAGSTTAAHMAHSIIAGNTAPDKSNCSGSLSSEGTNWIQVNDCSVTIVSGGAIKTGDPKLNTTLATNGGSTPTHALQSDSEGAIDQGDVAGCKDKDSNLLITDQRGLTRPIKAAAASTQAICDLGSFELNLCGNGSVDATLGEQCDDGNLVSGDCCSSTCQVENLGQTTCGVGTCQVTVDKCSSQGSAQACTPLPPAAELCDDLDNDCDGATDETFTDKGAACTVGTGACSGTGTMVCNKSDGTTTVCSTQASNPGTETCNGIDDDCDGSVDDGLGQTTCGVGACLVTVDNCKSGQTQTCTAKAAGTETCNGIDDDCDGSVDDNLGQTSCGVGACVVTIDNCKDGKSQTCTAKTAGTETCNGIDDDCDGTTDEELGQTTCGQGLCKVTVDNCKNAQAQTCAADETKKTTETCGNKIDEDCDGKDAECPATGTGTGTETPTTTEDTGTTSSSGGCTLIP